MSRAALFCILLAPAPVLAAEPIVLIANAGLNVLDETSLATLRQLFLGRRSSVGGVRIHCFEPAPGTPLRRAFSRLALELSERDLERYWLEQALSGGPPPPREIASERELVEWVAARPGAVAYLGWEAFSALPHEGVKVLRIRTGDRSAGPLDPAYPLRFEESDGS